MFTCDRTCNRGVLGVDHVDGPPGCCVDGATAIIVSLFSQREILGVAYVQRVVNTPEDVSEWHSTTMPSSPSTKQDEATGPSIGLDGLP